MNWQNLSTESHYKTAVAVRDALRDGRADEASDGIEELIDAMGRQERRAMRSQLIRLMTHVIKWKVQPERRSRSWSLTILHARREIADIQEETPSITNAVIQSVWGRALDAAMNDATVEMGVPVDIATLTWDDVFVHPYSIK